MCGRYAAGSELDELVEAFDVAADNSREATRSLLKNPQDPPVGAPDYNMAPTKQAPIVLTRPDSPRQLRHLTWGLIPSWAKDTRVGLRMINARAETVLDKPAFARAASARRCLVPADGWYEWQVSPVAVDAKGKPRKQPFYIHRDDEVPLAFAGLYEFWRDPALDRDDPLAWVVSFAIVTTAADPGMDRIHDRQPLVLDPGDWDRWLDPELTDPAVVGEMLAFARPGRFAAHPVGTAIGSSRAKGVELTAPIPRSGLDGVLDPETGEIIERS